MKVVMMQWRMLKNEDRDRCGYLKKLGQAFNLGLIKCASNYLSSVEYKYIYSRKRARDGGVGIGSNAWGEIGGNERQGVKGKAFDAYEIMFNTSTCLHLLLNSFLLFLVLS